MKQLAIWSIVGLAVLLAACPQPKPPEDVTLTDPPAGVSLKPIEQPGPVNVEPAITEACEATGKPPASPPASLFAAGPSGGNSGNKPMSVHDQPPDGGDGSFRMNLGPLGCPLVEDGKVVHATHSHREWHYLWWIDMPPAQQSALKYESRYMLIGPDHKIDFELEQLYGSFFNWFKKAGVTVQQRRIPQYATSCFKNHMTSCTKDEDYVWAITPTGKSQIFATKTSDGALALNSWTFPFWNSQRIKSMTVSFKDRTTNTQKTKTIPFSSGCASFQICGRWNTCRPLTPKCPYVSVDPKGQVTF